MVHTAGNIEHSAKDTPAKSIWKILQDSAWNSHSRNLLSECSPRQLSWAQVIADDLNLLTNYFMRLTFVPPRNWHTSANWCWILIQLCQSWLYICTYSILRAQSLENLIGCFVTFLRKEIPVLFCLNVLVTQNTSMPSEGCVVKSNTPYFAYSFLWFKLTNY